MEVKTRKISTITLVVAAMMSVLAISLALSPIGTISLPMVRITIAHLPIIITAIVFGLEAGLIVAFAFGLTSLLMALTAPVSLLDPFFVNPLISILPRLLIPITSYFSYKGLAKILKPLKGGDYVAAGLSVAIGNLTNTFGVYTMLYLVYARQILDKTGTPAFNLIITLISTTTLIKCIAIVIVGVPIVFALNRMKRTSVFSKA